MEFLKLANILGLTFACTKLETAKKCTMLERITHGVVVGGFSKRKNGLLGKLDSSKPNLATFDKAQHPENLQNLLP